MKLKNPRLLFSILGVVVVFAVLALFFWSFLRDTVVLPLYRFFIILRYGVNSIPQGFFLFIIFLVLLVIIIRAVSMTFKGQVSLFRFEGDDVAAYPADFTSRYRFWRLQTSTLYRSNFARNDFARNARRMILELIAHQEHRTWDEIERLVMLGEMTLPPLIDELVHERSLRSSRADKRGLDAFLTRTARQLGIPIADQPDPVLDEQVNAIIQFIEERLEIVHNESSLI